MASAYILHTRPWRETSLIVELFSAEHGRVGVIARGARRRRRGAGQLLQPFTQIRCSWRGRGELRTLTEHELERNFVLAGDAVYAGFYLNELLMRLLQREDPHPRLFQLYADALDRLAGLRPAQPGTGPGAGDEPMPAALEAFGSLLFEPVLRRFELGLLDDLGYGFPLDVDVQGHAVEPAAHYRMLPDAGVERVRETAVDGAMSVRDGQGAAGAGHGVLDGVIFAGADLLAIAGGEFGSPAVLRAAKRLTRGALAPHLGSRPLASRALFSR